MRKLQASDNVVYISLQAPKISGKIPEFFRKNPEFFRHSIFPETLVVNEVVKICQKNCWARRQIDGARQWRDLATVTFVRKIGLWRIFCVNISWPGDLDLWPWNCAPLLPMRFATFLPILVFLESFILDVSANTLVRRITWPCDLDLWLSRSRRVSMMRVFMLHLCIRYTKSEVRIGLSVRKILHIYCVSRPGDLDLWTFNL